MCALSQSSDRDQLRLCNQAYGKVSRNVMREDRTPSTPPIKQRRSRLINIRCSCATVAKGFVGERFAAAQPDLLCFGGAKSLRCQAHRFVKTVAEGLARAAPAGAPPIVLPRFDTDAIGRFLRGNRFGDRFVPFVKASFNAPGGGRRPKPHSVAMPNSVTTCFPRQGDVSRYTCWSRFPRAREAWRRSPVIKWRRDGRLALAPATGRLLIDGPIARTRSASICSRHSRGRYCSRHRSGGSDDREHTV